MLYSLDGLPAFEVAPVNVEGLDRTTGAEFAEKPVLGRRPPLEFVGESPEELTFRGKVFPEAFGGGDELETMRAASRDGAARQLQRGDGRNLEWWAITSFRETATRLDGKGVPRVVEFELSLKRADKPSADEYRGRIK